MTTATKVRREEKAAAAVEGLIAIDNNASLKALIDRHRAVKGRMAPLAKEKKSIERQISRHITKRTGAVGALIWNGRVVARLSRVNNHPFDQKGLKARYPRIFAQFTSTSPTIRLKVE